MSDIDDDLYFDAISTGTIVRDVEQVSRPVSVATGRHTYSDDVSAVSGQSGVGTNVKTIQNESRKEQAGEQEVYNAYQPTANPITSENNDRQNIAIGRKSESVPEHKVMSEHSSGNRDDVPVAQNKVKDLIAKHDSNIHDKKSNLNVTEPIISAHDRTPGRPKSPVSVYCFAKPILEESSQFPDGPKFRISEQENAEKLSRPEDIPAGACRSDLTCLRTETMSGLIDPTKKPDGIAHSQNNWSNPQLNELLKHRHIDQSKQENEQTTALADEALDDKIYDSVCENRSSSKRSSNESLIKDFEVIGHQDVAISKPFPQGKHVVDKPETESKSPTQSEKFVNKDYDWKQRKNKSKALKRTKKSENPFTQHSKFDDPHAGAMPEAEASDITDHLNPFTMLSSDNSNSDSSVPTDSTFDSSSDEDVYYEPEKLLESNDSYRRKPLPPTPKTNQLKDLKQLINPKPVDIETETEVVLQRVETMRLKRPITLPDGPAELSQTQIKLRGVLQSLIDSEKNYIGSLDRLVSDFQQPITGQFGVKKPEVKITFKQIENILNLHKMFKLELADKLDNWYAEEEIGNIFHMFSQRMVIDFYSDYVNNFEAASEIIKEMENSKPSFKEFLRNKQMSSVDRLSISGLMLKPIQRFPQFIMIIKDLLKYTPRDHHDREPLQEGLTGIENVAHQLNERKRQSEQYYHGQQIINKLAPRLHPEKNVFLIRQDDMEQVTQDNTGVNNVKQRRLFLMNDKLVSVHVTHRDQDGESTERFTYKWHRSLQDLELTTSAITPNMRTKVHTEIRNTTIHSPKLDLHTERSDDDPISIAGELTDMMHDISVLAQVTQLVSTLKLAYPGLTEDHFHEITTNLQKEIQGKDYQLQMLNSSTIIIQDKVRKKRYIFSAPSANVKQEWCIDFLLAKFALDVVNIPSWYKQDQDDISQPALLMKHMTVDMQRTFTRVKCSVPVYFPTKSEGSVEHLWVCSSTESQGQVSLVSLHSAKPGLIESFQATKCEILCVEMVPGFSIVSAATAFEEDTVWMSTADSEILVLMLSEKQSGLHRRAVYTFQPGSLVISMTYEDDRVFCGTAAGMLVVYSRNDDGIWTLSNKLALGVGSVTSIITVNDSLWTACGNTIYVVNPDTCVIKDKIHHQLADSEVHVNFLVKAGVGVWVSFNGQPNISLFHGESKRLLQDCNICTAINDFISVYSGNKETSKNYEVTCLMASLGLLWVGTNVGIILTYPLPRLRDGVPRINHRPQVALHGHNGPVKFIIPVHYGPVSGVPIRRRPSSILKRNKVDHSVISKLSRVDEHDRNSRDSKVYVSLDAEAMVSSMKYDDDHLYESVKYGSREAVNTRKGAISRVRDDKSELSPVNAVKNELSSVNAGGWEASSQNVYTHEADENKSLNSMGGVERISGDSSSLVQSDEHKYFILEPGSNKIVPADMGTGEATTNVRASVYLDMSGEHNTRSLTASADTSVQLRDKPGRNMPAASFRSELKSKLRDRKPQADCDVTDDNVDRLYPTLTRSLNMDNCAQSHRHSTLQPISQEAESMPETVYTRPFMHSPISIKKPDMSATRVKSKTEKDKGRRNSNPPKQIVLPPEVKRSSSAIDAKPRKESVGTSFSAGGSVDTLRKQNTNTILVLSGGDGYKDWKKRQSLQNYRPEEPCLTFWMYKF